MLSARGAAWCEVWGSPVRHSLSPVLHRAAYAALGLEGWTYDRREVDAASFGSTLASVAAGCRGLSLTMPLKEAALRAATRVDPVAAATGAANTLVPATDGWDAHNTDVDGIRLALLESGVADVATALVVGSGATARSAVAALAALASERSAAAPRLVLMVRDRPRPETLRQAREAGLAVEVVPMGAWVAADVVVSTVPPASFAAPEGLPPVGPAGPATTLLDAVYGEGRTPLQDAAGRVGWTVVPGTAMLLHQATRQVELMTGRPAPLEAMRVALAEAVDRTSESTSRRRGEGDDA